MQPERDVSGIPFNSHAIPLWLYPDVWDETKPIRLRGLWFVLLYALSFLVLIASFMFIGALIFSRPLGLMLWFSLVIGIPGGGVIGLGNWWDFTRRRKKLLQDVSSQTTSSQESPQG